MEPIGGLPEDLRDRVMADPALVLDDAELMRVLVSAQDAARGATSSICARPRCSGSRRTSPNCATCTAA